MSVPLEDYILDVFRTGEQFAFSRWGDGEWRAVLGANPGKTNCDKHKYFPEMCKELGEVLERKPKYMLGMQNMARRMFGEKIDKWLETRGLADLKWVQADVLHYMAIHGRLNDLLDSLKHRRIIMVGPPHLRRLKTEQLSFETFVGVPAVNAYLEKDLIVQDIRDAIAGREGARMVIALSASMPAEIILDEVYEECVAGGHSVVDFGSLWDPLVGVRSRSYMRNKSTI